MTDKEKILVEERCAMCKGNLFKVIIGENEDHGIVCISCNASRILEDRQLIIDKILASVDSKKEGDKSPSWHSLAKKWEKKFYHCEYSLNKEIERVQNQRKIIDKLDKTLASVEKKQKMDYFEGYNDCFWKFTERNEKERADIRKKIEDYVRENISYVAKEPNGTTELTEVFLKELLTSLTAEKDDSDLHHVASGDDVTSTNPSETVERPPLVIGWKERKKINEHIDELEKTECGVGEYGKLIGHDEDCPRFKEAKG